jgi:hypothetical protein
LLTPLRAASCSASGQSSSAAVAVAVAVGPTVGVALAVAVAIADADGEGFADVGEAADGVPPCPPHAHSAETTIIVENNARG